MSAPTFGKLPTALALDASLSDRAVRLYVVLAACVDNHSRQRKMRRADVAGYAGMSVATYKRAARELVDAGWLAVDGNGGNRDWNTYTLRMTNRLNGEPSSDVRRLIREPGDGSSVSHAVPSRREPSRRSSTRSARAARAPAPATTDRQGDDDVPDNACLPAMPEPDQPIEERCMRAYMTASGGLTLSRTMLGRIRREFVRCARTYEPDALLVAAREMGERGYTAPRAVESFIANVAARQTRAARPGSREWMEQGAIHTAKALQGTYLDPFAQQQASGGDT